MSHDSRYETECPHGHGWYYYEDGCAVAGCENAPPTENPWAYYKGLTNEAALEAWGEARRAEEAQKKAGAALPAEHAPPDSRSPYDGMVDFTPEQALRWALDYIADGSDETPGHVCEFTTDPPKGACEFHERYWAAREILEWMAARPALAGREEVSPIAETVTQAKPCARCGGTEFVCANCNDIVTGEAAAEIRREIREGTPDTSERKESEP